MFHSLALAAALTAATPAARPNVVMLLADDLGYGDLGCTGHPYAKTPAIDRLARDGTLFATCYVGGGTCCPSRTALMSGRFPATFAKTVPTHGLGDAATVTAVLKAAGYRTGHVGKWHLGETQADGTYGIDTVKVIGGNRRDPRGRDAVVTDDAVAFIKASAGQPFYLNVWFHTPHNPVNPPAAFPAKFADLTLKRSDFPNPDQQAYFDRYAKLSGGKLDEGLRNYLGDVLQLDTQVARVLKALDEQGLRDNTIVAFSSDNGPADGVGLAGKDRFSPNQVGSAGPHRGRKHTLFDGGVRQPLIVRWPGVVPAGRTDRTSVLAFVDWLPTLAAVVGAKPAVKSPGGESVLDIWKGATRPRTTDLFWRTSVPTAEAFVRRGDYKLWQPRKGTAELYDVAADPGERTNLAGKQPATAKELAAALAKWKATLPAKYDGAEDKD